MRRIKGLHPVIERLFSHTGGIGLANKESEIWYDMYEAELWAYLHILCSYHSCQKTSKGIRIFPIDRHAEELVVCVG